MPVEKNEYRSVSIEPPPVHLPTFTTLSPWILKAPTFIDPNLVVLGHSGFNIVSRLDNKKSLTLIANALDPLGVRSGQFST